MILGPHWAVKHAAFEALLQLLRHGDLGNGIMTLLPPALKLSATSAVPEVVTTVRAHLQKQPDPQVCFGAVLSTPPRLCGRGLCKRRCCLCTKSIKRRMPCGCSTVTVLCCCCCCVQAQTCFAQQYPQLAVQHMQQLAAHAASGSCPTAAQHYAARGPAALVGPSSFSAHLQGLQDLLAACGEAAALAGIVSAGGDNNTCQAASAIVGVCNEGFAHPADPCAASAQVAQCPDDGADGAKALLVQAAVASRSLHTAEQVGCNGLCLLQLRFMSASDERFCLLQA